MIRMVGPNASIHMLRKRYSKEMNEKNRKHKQAIKRGFVAFHSSELIEHEHEDVTQWCQETFGLIPLVYVKTRGKKKLDKARYDLTNPNCAWAHWPSSWNSHYWYFRSKESAALFKLTWG